MFELFQAGGALMWPILVCSLLAVTIIVERLWALNKQSVAPVRFADQVTKMAASGELRPESINTIRDHSPLGQIFAAGLVNASQGREVMKESIEESGRHVVHRLSRYLNTLGTIAAITPLIGLLGTVIGMIKVFTAITVHGVGDPTILSGGISEALLTTAAGLSVGIPSLMFYRYFRSRVAALTIRLEEYAMHLVETLQLNERQESSD